MPLWQASDYSVTVLLPPKSGVNSCAMTRGRSASCRAASNLAAFC